jgi:hypothetical protein
MLIVQFGAYSNAVRQLSIFDGIRGDVYGPYPYKAVSDTIIYEGIREINSIKLRLNIH